jgi:peroxiredoxin
LSALDDLPLLTATAQTVTLGEATRGRPAVLILMRHLGCLPCREHLLEVSQRRAEFEEARLLCITFVEPPLLAAYARELDLDGIEYFGDPSRRIYDALGFGRASFARVWLHPAVWRRYAVLVARGRRLHPPAQDVYQLGGDAILDAQGRLRQVFASAGPEDRPTVDALLAALP